MKCNAWVRREPVEGSHFNLLQPDFFKHLEEHGKVWLVPQPLDGHGGTALRFSIPRMITVDQLPVTDKPLYRRCSGKIVCQIEPCEEPYYGGMSASVKVEFRCDTCGNTQYPALPDDPESVAMLVTNQVESMPDPAGID